MPIVTFWNTAREQTGQTISAIATATNMAIQQNIKILLISTSLNDNTVKDSFWHEKPNMLSGLFGANVNLVNQNGIEGLDRIVRSNKISPELVKDYTKVVLKGRLEVLLGFSGTEEQYKDLCKQYLEIILAANQYYNLVIVDLAKEMDKVLQKEILKRSDIIIPIVSQKKETIEQNINFFVKVPDVSIQKAIFTLGRYNEKSKYNIKNIARNIAKSKNMVNIANTIPQNTLLYDASQEGKVVDLLLDFSRLKGKDENTELISQLTTLGNDIKFKINQMGK